MKIWWKKTKMNQAMAAVKGSTWAVPLQMMSKVSQMAVSNLFLVEVNSAMDYDEKQKIKMYQLEWQFNSESNKDRENVSPAKVWRDKVRPVSVFDYNEYRKLEDKKDRIALKKELYERKKDAD
jgi:hypothetical protein